MEKDPNGNTALMVAVQKGSLSCVRELLKHFPEVQVVARNNTAFVPLSMACCVGHVECVKELLKHDPVSQLTAQNAKGGTALMLACEFGQCACVRELLQSKAASQIAVKDDIGFTAVTHAFRNGHVGCVKELLKHNSASKPPINDSAVSCSSFIEVCYEGKLACVMALIEKFDLSQSHERFDIMLGMRVAEAKGFVAIQNFLHDVLRSRCWTCGHVGNMKRCMEYRTSPRNCLANADGCKTVVQASRKAIYCGCCGGHHTPPQPVP